MKKRNTPFALVAVMVVLIAGVFFVNAKNHANEPPSPQDQAQQQQDKPADASQPASPSAADLSAQLSAQLGDVTAKAEKSATARQKPMLLRPNFTKAAIAASKPDPASTNSAGWYQQDSALSKK